MQTSTSLPQLLQEIVRGAAPADCTRDNHRGPLHQVAVAEEGTIPLVTVIAVVFFMLLIGFLGNTGRVVKEKIEIQNSSDALAYSSALWMARGMNAVTATNHLLGEATAICVVHEAIGGPELDELSGPPTAGSGEDAEGWSTVNKVLEGLGESVALFYLAPQPDKQFLTGPMVDALTMDEGKYTSGAAIYDAQGTLKFVGGTLLLIKTIGNLCMMTKFLIPVGVGLHAVAAPFQPKVTIEAYLLKGMEYVAWGTKYAKWALEDYIIPAMARYPEKILDPILPIGDGYGNLIGLGMNKTMQGIGKANVVDQVLFPAAVATHLPLKPEAKLKTTSTAREPDLRRAESTWPEPLEAAVSGFSDTLDFITGVLDKIKALMDSILGFIPGLKQIWELVEGPYNELMAAVDAFKPPPHFGYDANPSRKLFKSELKADWNEVRYSQWVRATYPWVDAYRAPIRGLTGNFFVLGISKFGMYHVHWSNRYTLSKVFQYRQGRERNLGGGNVDPLDIYIMDGMKPREKGKEYWATNSREAEKLFTLIGFTRRTEKTLMSPIVYKQMAPEDFVTYSQAMVYNANPQKPVSGVSDLQPEIGWDTLNFEGRAKEWGAKENTGNGSNNPMDILKVFQFMENADPPRIKLNWQAKLVPVTRTRIKEAAPGVMVHEGFRRAISPWLIPVDGVDPQKLNTH